MSTSPLNPVGWFEIYVKDLEASRIFFEAVLGLSRGFKIYPRSA